MTARPAEHLAAIDPLALVSPRARLAPTARIGPFCRVDEGAVIEDGVNLVSHVVVEGRTRIGAGTQVHPFTVLGGAPQHIRYDGENTALEIGAGCVIREQVSIHRGTVQGGGVTRLGAGVMVMAASHVGHDCQIGDGAILASNCTLAGHVEVGEGAFIGGLAGIHQFCRIGARAFVGGCAAVPMDVIPFGSALGNHARLGGLNLVGLKRSGLDRESIHTLRAAFHDLFLATGKPFAERVEAVAATYAGSAEAMAIVDFIRADARRPILGARD